MLRISGMTVPFLNTEHDEKCIRFSVKDRTNF